MTQSKATRSIIDTHRHIFGPKLLQKFVGKYVELPRVKAVNSLSAFAVIMVFAERWEPHCSKAVVVLCSQPIRLDQNGASRVAGKWLTNHVE
jgi:hypothetical protein